MAGQGRTYRYSTWETNAGVTGEGENLIGYWTISLLPLLLVIIDPTENLLRLSEELSLTEGWNGHSIHLLALGVPFLWADQARTANDTGHGNREA